MCHPQPLQGRHLMKSSVHCVASTPKRRALPRAQSRDVTWWNVTDIASITNIYIYYVYIAGGCSSNAWLPGSRPPLDGSFHSDHHLHSSNMENQLSIVVVGNHRKSMKVGNVPKWGHLHLIQVHHFTLFQPMVTGTPPFLAFVETSPSPAGSI